MSMDPLLERLLAAFNGPAGRAEQERVAIDEGRRFQAEYQTSFRHTKQAARKGDLDALCRLIQWDKKWLVLLGMPRLTAAHDAGDMDTLRRIGEAVMSVPPSHAVPQDAGG